MSIFDKFKTGFKKSASTFTSGLKNIIIKYISHHHKIKIIRVIFKNTALGEKKSASKHVYAR